MSMAIVGGVAAAAVGGGIAASGAKSAAKTQAKSAADATAAQERMFDRQVELQEPWRETGEQGLNRLSYLLGIDGEEFGGGRGTRGGGSSKAAGRPFTLDDFVGYNNRIAPEGYAVDGQMSDANDQFRLYESGVYGDDQNAIAQRFGFDPARIAQAQQQSGEEEARRASDPEYGSLLKSFGLSDFVKDPGYDFRLNEGRKTLEGSAAARGGLFSGAAGKALTRYGQDYGSNEFGKAFDRYNVNQTNKFNRLATIAGVGQTAANQTGAAAARFGEQAGSNIIGAGNATAAGQVGASNAWNNAVTQGYNNYQSNELMKRLQAPATGGYRYSVPMYEGAEY